MTEKKQGFFARRAQGTKRYVARRFGNRVIGIGYESMKNGLEGTRKAMTPVAIDRKEFNQGLDGRYIDGGVARFAEMMKQQGIRKEDLPLLEKSRSRSAGIMFLSAGIFLMFGAWLMIRAENIQYVLFGFSTAFTAFIFVALALRHDYSLWQIRQRRFGGFMEYLKGVKGAKKTGTEIVSASPDKLPR